MSSGILYIGSDQQDSNKKYIPVFPYAYRLRSGAGIQTSKTQEENEPDFGPYISFRFLNSEEQTRGSIMITSKNRINFNCQENGATFSDRYLLPEPSASLTEDKWYSILTSKNTVTVAQGGTGRDTLTAGCALVGNGTGQVLLRSINNTTTITSIPYGGTKGPSLITANTLAYWNGAYEAENGSPSNLAYCNKGAFGDAATKGISSPNLKAEGGYTTGEISSSADELLLNGRTIRWWNGAHTKTTSGSTVSYSSNLAYCNKGAFGTFATKNASTFLQSPDDTVRKIVLKGTTSETNGFSDTNPQICFYNLGTGTTQNPIQAISLTFSDKDAIQRPASLTLNGNQGGEYFIAPFVKATFVTTSYGTSDPTGTGAIGQLYFKVV